MTPEHCGCAKPRIYAMQDVTVWVRVYKDGRLGGIRDSKQSIAADAREQVAPTSDIICAECGWMGRLDPNAV